MSFWCKASHRTNESHRRKRARQNIQLHQPLGGGGGDVKVIFVQYFHGEAEERNGIERVGGWCTEMEYMRTLVSRKCEVVVMGKNLDMGLNPVTVCSHAKQCVLCVYIYISVGYRDKRIYLMANAMATFWICEPIYVCFVYCKRVTAFQFFILLIWKMHGMLWDLGQS